MCSSIAICRLLVTCGVTVSRIPVSLNCTLAVAVAAGAAGVDHPDRRFLTHEDVGLAVVQRGDDRLRLDVGEVHPLQRAQERGQGEAAQRGGEDQVERGADDRAVALPMADTALPPRSMMLTSGS